MASIPVAKPETIPAYRAWLRKEHGVKSQSLQPMLFDDIVNRVEREFRARAFWTELLDRLPEMEEEYHIDTGYSLLLPHEASLLTKSWDSFLLKTYRYNVLDNGNWPTAPRDGWLLPADWYSRINDLVRTMFVVKYLDGVAILAKEFERIAKDLGLACDVSWKARDSGYYAAHIILTDTFEIPGTSYKPVRCSVMIEIQITTQLQETILKLTHTMYEQRRVRVSDGSKPWQWDYKSDEFVANYLGHMLHYLEGMIMEVRDKQRRTSDGKPA